MLECNWIVPSSKLRARWRDNISTYNKITKQGLKSITVIRVKHQIVWKKRKLYRECLKDVLCFWRRSNWGRVPTHLYFVVFQDIISWTGKTHLEQLLPFSFKQEWLSRCIKRFRSDIKYKLGDRRGFDEHSQKEKSQGGSQQLRAFSAEQRHSKPNRWLPQRLGYICSCRWFAACNKIVGCSSKDSRKTTRQAKSLAEYT